jgi:Zn-dependent M28 family amino/carboxypeptidase
MANEILGYAGQTVETLKTAIEKDYEPHSMPLPGVAMKIETRLEEQLVQCRNVLGFIEGSDPELKNEVVVIGAHLDHLGKRGDYIFNGADDNGSGSVAVMEVAHAFAVNPVKPKRSVLFALWTGEEKGLLGSRHYTLHPFFPLGKTVAYINLDMVSREWTMERLLMAAKRFGMDIPEGVDPAKFFSLQLCRTPGIKDALKENNRYVGLHIFFRESDRGSGGSDHASFSSQKVPWAAFFGAMTDDYHHATDSHEKVNLTLIEKAARLTWLTVFSLADRGK